MSKTSLTNEPPLLQKHSVSGCTLFFGDCLIESDKIESGSVDLILTDLPYGNMQGIDFDDMTHGKKENKNQKIYWDELLPLEKMFEICNRILRKNGKAIFTAQGSFVFELYNKQIPNLPFSYKMIWDKQQFANCLLVNKAPLNYYEDIFIFSKNHDLEGLHPLIPYFKNIMEFIGLNKKTIVEKIGQSADHCFRVDSSQFSLCTERTYKELTEAFGIDKMIGFKDFTKLKAIDEQFKNEFASTFNLWDGNKYKSNILKYKKDYNGYHPTQKPVLLLEDLIKTFSNENDLVVDLTMGSGSTGVACKNTNRSFIGIEKDENYYNVALRRVSEYCH